MISMESVITALHSGLGLLLLWILVYFGVREYRVDRTRQKLFALRDELFDYAADGGIGFDDTAYGRVRTLLNSLIRFSHMLTFSRLVLSSVAAGSFTPQITEGPHQKLMSAIDAIPSEDAKAKLRDIHGRIGRCIVTHLVTGSPLGMVYVFAYVLRALASDRFGKSKTPKLHPVDRLEDDAMLAEDDSEAELAHVHC